MNSLVGYGVSSESDSDGEVEDGPAPELPDAASAATRSRYFLLEPDSASSDSEEEEQESSSPSTPASSNPPPPPSSLTSNKLPPPSLNTCSDSGVFANPFRAQAEQKLSALQKHVPLTMQAKPSQIGGKRMCVSYRKDGRCRFGIKCKFAHDSDLQTPVTPADCHQAVSEGEEAQGSDPAEAAGAGGGSQKLQQELKEDESGGQEVKKRRVGLSNTLIPPKRAMKQYTMHRDRERLNMS
ncbi:hypothetical protein E3U43_008289 [Larimichthys crocea]|uniref:Uncharacterized protein n=1 Tax=Larimichthys crocea TaxID=215358 RepID=A0ACD3RUZ1_LARCR|nr:hypothetical protein E3U43_008289 [Larimichthys crocea]